MEYSQFEGIIVIFSHSHGNFMRLDPQLKTTCPWDICRVPNLLGGWKMIFLGFHVVHIHLALDDPQNRISSANRILQPRWAWVYDKHGDEANMMQWQFWRTHVMIWSDISPNNGHGSSIREQPMPACKFGPVYCSDSTLKGKECRARCMTNQFYLESGLTNQFHSGWVFDYTFHQCYPYHCALHWLQGTEHQLW